MAGTTETHSRVHTFGSRVAISFSSSDTMYLTPEDALALSTELRRFAKGCKEGIWYSTRVIKDGKATNEKGGKRKPETI